MKPDRTGPEAAYDAIGGFMDLSGNHPRIEYPSRYVAVQSARAALELLLTTYPPKKLWLPRYICDAMIGVAKKCGCDYKLYSIDEGFKVDRSISIGDGEYLLYVNYFGVTQGEEEAVVERFGEERIVLDRAQALFDEFPLGLASLYSPRKFVGVPDGGILVSRKPFTNKLTEDTGATMRCFHLLRRLEGRPEDSYDEYRRAERTLMDTSPMRMSSLTRYLVESVDKEYVRRRRSENFRYLHSELEGDNKLTFDMGSIVAPLCYPLWPKRRSCSREALWDRRIFVPQYWPEVADISCTGSFERAMAEECLCLPCDQRYGADEMYRVIDFLKGT